MQRVLVFGLIGQYPLKRWCALNRWRFDLNTGGVFDLQGVLVMRF